MYRYELGRQPANTKLSSNKTVRRVRVRGGNVKWRALRLDTGNFSWGSEAESRKARLLDVVYNASNNELVRTQTLVLWYQQHYGVDIGRKKKTTAAAAAKKEGEFGGGRLLACISSRPGQCGRADGYVRLSHLLQLLGQIYGIYYDVCVYSFDIKKLFPCWLAGTYWRAKSWSCT
ncbi:40S ribosomal protein S8 [Linum perenne]